jgi:hypothetical protein
MSTLFRYEVRCVRWQVAGHSATRRLLSTDDYAAAVSAASERSLDESTDYTYVLDTESPAQAAAQFRRGEREAHP